MYRVDEATGEKREIPSYETSFTNTTYFIDQIPNEYANDDVTFEISYEVNGVGSKIPLVVEDKLGSFQKFLLYVCFLKRTLKKITFDLNFLLRR